ncbi:MAG: LuxR C-terminal-related transcriptional regulator [Chloroflexota bacterium]
MELVGRLHQASSNSKIAVCADDLNGPVLAALWQIPIDEYLSWSDMTPERLHPVLLLVTAGIRVVGAHCMEVLMDVRESGRAGGAEPMLSGLERGTLEGLLAGQREREIADELKVGERTVSDVVARLKRKFDAPTLFVLGTRVWPRRNGGG